MAKSVDLNSSDKLKDPQNLEIDAWQVPLKTKLVGSLNSGKLLSNLCRFWRTFQFYSNCPKLLRLSEIQCVTIQKRTNDQWTAYFKECHIYTNQGRSLATGRSISTFFLKFSKT